VRVTGEDGREASGLRIEVELQEVVKDIDRVGTDLDDVICRKAGSPSTLVVIAADPGPRRKIKKVCSSGGRLRTG
jgi:hypothetical protein